MINTLTAIGITVTALYSGAIYLLINNRIDQLLSMRLNEVGDFLAGVFGPLAIFWLILGFLQQGKELQQSTRALELQAEELNNSVQQQKELVEVSRQQVEAEMEALKYERQRQKELANPYFIFRSYGGTHHGNGTGTLTFNVKNTGGLITKVSLVVDKVINISPNIFDAWETNQEYKFAFAYSKETLPESAGLSIKFIDRLGNNSEQVFTIIFNNTGIQPTMIIS